MARELHPGDLHRLEPPTVVTHRALTRVHPIDLLFSKHPLYALRKSHIAIAAVGIFLFLIGSGRISEVAVFAIFALFFSGFICAADLLIWASRKAKEPDDDPAWPLKKCMVGDAILAVVLQLTFWAGVEEMQWGGYYGDGAARMAKDYGYLAVMICSLLHAYAFWKEFMASCTRSWLASLQLPIAEPCARCGYTSPPDPTFTNMATSRCHHPTPTPQHSTHTHAGPVPVPPQQARQPRAQLPPNLHPYAGPSAFLTPASAISPPSSSTDPEETRMEEGLLIGSEYGGTRDYGSIDASAPVLPAGASTASRRLQAECEEVLESPADVVVGSGGRRGGKKREKERAGK